MIGVGAGGPTGAWATSAEPSPALAGEPVTPAAAALGRPARLTERQAWAVLTWVDGLGPVGFGALLRAFGSGRAVLEAALRPGATRRLVEAGVVDERESFDATTAGAIAAVAEDPRAVLRRIEIPGVEILTTEDAAYPSRLRSIELPPHVLFVRGDVEAHGREPRGRDRRDAPADRGRQGDRRRGSAGRSRRPARSSSRASRSASTARPRGRDGRGRADGRGARLGPRPALPAGPREARRAHRRRRRRGRLGVRARDGRPASYTFPRRNRLISGLADATVVVEAGARSGALITAAWALEQGRDLFIVPGSIDAPRSAGCLEWIRRLSRRRRASCASIPELIEDLELFGGDDRARPARRRSNAELIELGATARAIAEALVRGRGTVDELVAATGHSVATVLGALTMLEMRGLATSAYGRYRPAGRLATAPRRPPRRG